MTQYIYCPCVICIVFCLSPAAPKKNTSHLHQAFAGELMAGLQLLGEGAWWHHY